MLVRRLVVSMAVASVVVKAEVTVDLMDKIQVVSSVVVTVGSKADALADQWVVASVVEKVGLLAV